MKVRVLGGLIPAFLLILPGAGCSSGDPEPPERSTAALAQERLARLAECGIQLKPGTRVEELLAGSDFDPAEPPARQYLALLLAMGAPLDREPNTFPSDAVFTLELESIENQGDYAFLARRLRTLAGGKLPLRGIEDDVDLAKQQALVAFHIGKRRYRWQARIRGTRVDPDILAKFADLLKRRNSEVRFLVIRPGGDVILIGCASNRQMRCLRNLGLPARWL